jgi:ATP-dependent DNA ligase
MLAARKAPESVVKLMEGRPFVIENKFDGERVQVHKDGKTIKLFSRFVLLLSLFFFFNIALILFIVANCVALI